MVFKPSTMHKIYGVKFVIAWFIQDEHISLEEEYIIQLHMARNVKEAWRGLSVDFN